MSSAADQDPWNSQNDRLEHLEARFAELSENNKGISDLMMRILERIHVIEEAASDNSASRASVKTDPIPVATPVIAPLSPVHIASPVHKPTMGADSRNRIKPSPPPDFSGDRTKGCAFLNSCDLYIRLAPHQFENEEAKVAWAFSYMKSGHAALFIDRILRYEANGFLRKFPTWSDFRAAFKEEFYPKNERQRALTRLETSAYYQQRRAMDDYIDEFKDLIDLAGYQDGAAVVMKFHRGLRRDIQDLIAQLASGRPDDDDPLAWYAAALNCAENIETNALFHGVA